MNGNDMDFDRQLGAYFEGLDTTVPAALPGRTIRSIELRRGRGSLGSRLSVRRLREAAAIAALGAVALAIVGTTIILRNGPAPVPAATPSGSPRIVGPASPAPTLAPSPAVTPTPAPSASSRPSSNASTEPSAPATQPATSVAYWSSAGSLANGRGATHAVLLGDGRVLVVGDDNICTPGPAWDTSAAAEILDPPTKTWSSAAPLNAPRDGFVATALGSKALVAGGLDGNGVAYSSTKLFDPATGKWASSGLLGTARWQPAGATLADGRVLVAGGTFVGASSQKVLASAELFDPNSGTWSPTGSLAAARFGAKAVTLSDGRVLVVGGQDGSNNLLASAEVYDPTAATWSAAGSLATLRVEFSLVALPDGSALVAGGFADGPGGKALASAERWDPTTKSWKSAGNMLTAAADRTAVVLIDGRVLVAGGATTTQAGATAAAEIFDGSHWTATAPLPAKRANSAGVLLGDGTVLLAGGYVGRQGQPSTPWCPTTIASAVFYHPSEALVGR